MAKRTPSGKFRGKVTIGYDPDGKPIYKYVTAPTRRELENVKEAVREMCIRDSVGPAAPDRRGGRAHLG